MPGREDLIKENNARAYAAANTPQPQESVGKSVSSSIGGPRSLLGGNLDVFSALDKVEFQGSLGDGSLRGTVAYIRMWKRGGSAQQAASTRQTVEPPESDTLQILQEDLEAAIGNRDNVSNGFNPATGEYSYNPYGDVDNPIEVAEANIQIAENRLSEEKQKAISTQTPTSSKVASTTATAVPQSTKTATPSTPSVGAVKSANPSGFLNTLVNRGKALVGLPQEKPEYSGKTAGSNSNTTGTALGEMMWQFLFNPSELELDVGPEFKDAETWGVSDKGNSGKPLHWSHNKNAQLKFNSVLLNGFVFGRKVEALEQGLIELFMAREGEGQHGPHVLEFVWGKRVFGPCVIRNVNIKEKMWDEGEVVNAEVSFTLEQVPEWTINDGFVDVARPGRQPLAANPVAGATVTSATAPGATPAAGVGKSDQKAATAPQSEDFVGCKNLQQLKLNAIAFNPSPGFYPQIRDSLFSDSFAIGESNRRPYQSNFARNINSYIAFVTKGTNLGVSSSSKCEPSLISREYARLIKNSNDSLREIADKQMASFMNSCAAELGNKASNFYDQKNCKRFADPEKPNQPI